MKLKLFVSLVGPRRAWTAKQHHQKHQKQKQKEAVTRGKAIKKQSKSMTKEKGNMYIKD